MYSGYVAYVYKGEMFSLIGNQRVGIFPPKSKILFYLSLASIWCQNFQDRTIPVGGDTWTSFWRKDRRRRRRIIRIKKYRVQGYVLPVKYLQNGMRYSNSVFTMIKYKSHAKNCFKRRLCSCYRFWDIVVANIKNFKIFHFDENLLEQNRKSRRTSSYGLVIGIRIIRIRTRYTSVKQYVKPYEKKTTGTK